MRTLLTLALKEKVISANSVSVISVFSSLGWHLLSGKRKQSEGHLYRQEEQNRDLYGKDLSVNDI